jgi:hypothetical protein
MGCGHKIDWEWERVEVRVPQPLLSRAAELLHGVAEHPEKFFELETSGRLLVLHSLANAPLEDLLSKYDALIELIAQRDMPLFIILLGMMDTGKRFALARSKPALVERAARAIESYLGR